MLGIHSLTNKQINQRSIKGLKAVPTELNTFKTLGEAFSIAIKYRRVWVRRVHILNQHKICFLFSAVHSSRLPPDVYSEMITKIQLD